MLLCSCGAAPVREASALRIPGTTNAKPALPALLDTAYREPPVEEIDIITTAGMRDDDADHLAAMVRFAFDEVLSDAFVGVEGRFVSHREAVALDGGFAMRRATFQVETRVWGKLTTRSVEVLQISDDHANFPQDSQDAIPVLLERCVLDRQTALRVTTYFDTEEMLRLGKAILKRGREREMSGTLRAASFLQRCKPAPFEPLGREAAQR